MLTACLLLPMAIAILTIRVLSLFAFTTPRLAPNWLTGYLYTAVIGEGFVGAGLFEEIGWRGFALPHLQRRYTALTSSIIIGVAWVCWHIQNYMVFEPFPVFVDPFPWMEVAVFIPTVIAYSVVFTSVCNSTGGSLFAVVLLHGAIDAQGSLLAWNDLPQQSIPLIQAWLGMSWLVLAVALVWRYGATNLSRRDRFLAET